VERYGQDEVLTWYWELWNEPDIIYWKGTLDEYLKLYDYTEAAVHAVLQDARLGGPATTGPLPGLKSLDYLDKFLDHCRNGVNYYSGKKGTRLDYITFHVKGGGFSFKINAPKETPSIKHFVEQVECGLDTVKKYGYEDLEIVLSEADPDGWAAGGRFDNANMNFRNTEYYATYVASTYHKIYEIARERNMDVRPLVWAFLFIGERCFEGTRTFTTQGIDKPVFNLFKMFAKLGNKYLPLHSSQKKMCVCLKISLVQEKNPSWMALPQFLMMAMYKFSYTVIMTIGTLKPSLTLKLLLKIFHLAKKPLLSIIISMKPIVMHMLNGLIKGSLTGLQKHNIMQLNPRTALN